MIKFPSDSDIVKVCTPTVSKAVGLTVKEEKSAAIEIGIGLACESIIERLGTYLSGSPNSGIITVSWLLI